MGVKDLNDPFFQWPSWLTFYAVLISMKMKFNKTMKKRQFAFQTCCWLSAIKPFFKTLYDFGFKKGLTNLGVHLKLKI